MTEHRDAEVPDGEREDGEREDGELPTEGDADSDDDTGHLDDVEDGAGCTEIWERLSEHREAARNEAERSG